MVSRAESRAPPPVISTNPGTNDVFEQARESLRPDRSLRHIRLKEVAELLGRNQPEIAEEILRRFLKKHPRDADALHLMAEAAQRQGRKAEAETLLANSVKVAPHLASARFNYANALLMANKATAALDHAGELLKTEPRNPLFRRLRCKALDALGNYEASTACWCELVKDHPDRPECWTDYGHALRSLGQSAECIAAYRKALEICPTRGAAYWSLANLKTFQFDDFTVRQMEVLIARADLQAEDRIPMHFALGKAYADLNRFEMSFENYAKGNALFRLGIDYDPEVTTSYVACCKVLFTPQFFHARTGTGAKAADPIFIVGMPRSGSTLLEQILSSHPAIEGTAELPDIPSLARRLEEQTAKEYGTDYPDVLGKLGAATLNSLGEQYLESTRSRRKSGRPHFTDKMLNNALHIPLIHLILPNARIVDVRRHPMDCCFSNFTQHFANAQLYTYRLTELGRCYMDYVELMAHFDRVLPGKIHRFIYERLLADPETEIRRLLEYLDLPFEKACLQFYRNDRAVSTISSEQVRRPIFRDRAEHWRPYEPWLRPLKESLGDVLKGYPGVPMFPLTREC